MRLKALCLLAISIFSMSTWAVKLRRNGSPCGFWCRRKAELISPVTTDAKYTLIYGTGLTLGLLFFEDQIVDPTQEEVVEDKPLGNMSKFGELAGQLIPNAAYVAGMLIDAWLSGSSQSWHRADVMFKASAYAGVSAIVLKNIIREPRPYSASDRTSLPSGHTTTAFAFAGAVGELHGWRWGIPAYALATYVAFSRINDNKHFLHDVVAGATIGLSYGIGVAQADTKKSDTPRSSLFVLPTEKLDGIAVNAHWAF